jgi:hypothetical protein
MASSQGFPEGASHEVFYVHVLSLFHLLFFIIIIMKQFRFRSSGKHVTFQVSRDGLYISKYRSSLSMSNNNTSSNLL